MWKKLRITILLYIAVIVAMTSWSTRARHAEWNQSLWVTIYPINGDGSSVSQDYIDSLVETDFQSMEEFFVEQARVYKLRIHRPIEAKLSAPVDSLPPTPPSASSGLGVVFWSLKLRWWAWWENNFDGPSDIKIFVLYHDPATNPMLPHSLGLRQGFLGVVYAFADDSYRGQNKIIIAHELMHTLGASDQYDLASNYPVFPHGFAEPYRTPVFPQRKATLMAGRVPIDESTSKMPNSLNGTMISPQAAAEIGWEN